MHLTLTYILQALYLIVSPYLSPTRYLILRTPRLGSVQAYYSLNGGGNWLPAVPASATNNHHLKSSGIRNVIGYWPLDEGTGITIHDDSGHVMTGTLVGPTWITETNDILAGNSYALSFDGINDYIDLSHDERQNVGEELSLVAWVKLDDVTDSKIISKGLGAGYVLGISNGLLYPEIWDSAGVWKSFTGGSIPVGQWTHLAITWKSGDYLRGYVNGFQVAQTPATVNPIGNTSLPLRVGVASWDNTAHLTKGSIDDVRIYERALSTEEIFDLATGQCNKGCQHIFLWDTFASGFFGRSDNVVFRFLAIPQSPI